MARQRFGKLAPLWAVSPMSKSKRLATRMACTIDVQACTPIHTVDASIVDISRMGAQLRLDRPYPKGTRIHLDVAGHYYWGTVMWDEEDRIGLRFHSPVKDGPLDEAMKRLTGPRGRPDIPEPAAPRSAGFGRRSVAVAR